MCDASEHAAGYVLLIEDYTETNDGPMKTYAPVSFGSQRFTEGQMSLTMYAKEFLAMHFAFDEFAHILWGVKKPTIVMTDNKALTRFFQSKRIPPKLWNYCDQTLQFEFVMLMFREPRTLPLTTCPVSTYDRRNESTSNSTTRYRSSTSRLI